MRTFGLILLLLCLNAHGRELKFAGQEYPPFNSTIDHAYQGEMVDVVNAVCAHRGDTCTFASMPIARALLEARNGSIDGVLSLYFNDQRSEYLNFSDVIAATHLAFLGGAGALPLRSEAELSGFTVAAVRGSTTARILEEMARRLGNLKVVIEKDNLTLLQKLKAGRYGAKGAVFGTQIMLEHLAADLNIPTTTLLLSDRLELRIGFSRRLGEEVVADFNRELQKMRRAGELARIAKKYGVEAD